MRPNKFAPTPVKALMKLAPVAALAALLFLSVAQADEGDPADSKATKPVQAGFLFEWIELDHRAANQLVREHANQMRAGNLRKILGKMIDKKEAELVQTAYLTTKSQQRSKTESIDELIYPTEYDPAEIPMEIDKNTPAERLKILPPIPTAFDARNVGTTIEIEPVISKDGKLVELNLAPEIVRHLGDRGVGGPEPITVIKHPAFYAMKLHSNYVLPVGEFTLAGVLTPPGKADKRTLLMIRATVSE